MSGRVIVYGGSGALGATCVNAFRANGWWICNVDLNSNSTADANVVVKPESELGNQSDAVITGVKTAVGSERVDAVICVAGGWAGGNAASEDYIKNTDLVMKQSIWTSVISGRLSALFMKDNGFLLLTGAQPALGPTPGMIGYGMAKAAVHQLVKSLAADKSGLPSGSSVAAILPITLDTPMNRKFMPKADHSKWTPLEFVAEITLDTPMKRKFMPKADHSKWTPLEFVADKAFEWSSTKDSRPESGALVQLVTEGGVTKLQNA